MKILCALIVCIALFWQPAPSGAREIYAVQTGKACADCHLNPAGGGELTATGKRFAATLPPAAVHRTTLPSRLVRFAAGYLHLLTAILWFGTILYVHLVLKPAYAAGGLPRGEVRVGLFSMAVMAVTGAVLTGYRVDSLDMLLHTSFGILLLIKVSLYLLMVISAGYVIIVIGPKLKATRRGPSAPPVGADLGPGELACYDGKEGRPALFAYRGKLYDASSSRLWRQGVHMGRHNAGQDLTQALQLAPHGAEKMAELAEVGNLLTEQALKAPLHERVFFFMAYLNLTVVFLIVLIVALWRWA